MVRLLASRGASLTALGEWGTTLLADAVFTNDADVVKALLALGAEVDQVDQHGETALMHAAAIDHGDTAVLEALLEARARRDIAGPDGLTALSVARRHGHLDHARRLE